VVEAIAETYGYTQVSAYLLEGEELVLQHQVGYREVIERIPLTKGVSGRTIRTGQAVLLEDVRADRDFLGAIEDITSEICVPLFDEGEAVGFINVESRGGTKLTQKDLELMVTLGEHVSVALSRARLHTQVCRNEERLRSLADAAFEGILMSDAGEVLEANRALTDMLGYEQEELVGRSALEFVAPEHRDMVRRKIASEDEEPYEIVGLRKDGTLLDLEVRGRAFSYQGRSVRVTAVRDVTERKQAEHRLREAEERYRTLVERVPAMTYIHHQVPGQFSGATYVSPQVETVLGYTQEEYTADPEFWKTIIHPDDRERVLADDERTGETGEPFDLEFRMVAKDGRAVWFRESGTLVREEDGGSKVWHGVMFDITELKRVEGDLREAEERYRTLVERIPAVTFVDRADGSEEALYVSPQIEGLLGYTPDEWMEGHVWRERLHPDDRERVLASDERFEAEGEAVDEEYRLLAKDGSLVWVREETVLVRGEGGEPLYVQGIMSDVTEKKEAEERLEHQAFHDSLTGLPNRRLFMDRLGQALRRTRRRKKRSVAVLFMDLDGFKVINDSLGHDSGDRLLVEVAKRLGDCLRPEDTLARFGGDEFVVLIEGAGASDAAVRVAERILDELREPFALDGRELYVAASMGVGLENDSTKSPEELLREADTSMYWAKDEGSGYVVFDPSMHGRALDRLELENDLRKAIEEDEFVVHYQPIVNLQTGGLWGLEALVRWQHPERGLLGPDEFVPVAEKSGLVVPMGELVLEEACRRAVEWQRAFPRNPPLAMSVNLSGRQLRRPDLHEVVGRALKESGLPSSSLGLDITETVYISALDANSAALDRLTALGIRISLDDFGSGYSSLTYLKRLPADILKIDKSFTRGLGVEVEDTAIVQTVVDLAHILGMEVVAEGVETGEQETLLREMGCNFAQGFFFSRPLPSEKVPGFLSR
jgi:diguanylate cyclase (GGDEF)-like protein/PAS domain S-box-containing protein